MDEKDAPIEPGERDDIDTVTSASKLGHDADFDAVSAATRWSLGAKRNPEVPLPGVSYANAVKKHGDLHDAASAYASGDKSAKHEPDDAEGKEKERELPADEDEDEDVDTTTGATPGVASACKDLGLTSPDKVSKQLGIKPPGVV